MSHELLNLITIDSSVMAGKPVIKGTRLTVEYILRLLSRGMTVEEIVQEYSGLTEEDIRACLVFATKALEDTVFMPLPEPA